MPEVKKVQEYVEVEQASDIAQDRRVTSYVYDKTRFIRYEVVASAPVNDEEAQASYGCNLETLIKMGVRQAMYGCQFKPLIDLSIGEDWTNEKTLGELQSTVDNIDLKPKPKVERTKVAAETKAKARELDSLNDMAIAAGFANVAEFVQSLQKKAKK